MTTHVQRVAHRGGARLWPENTLAAFRNAATLAIDAVELDVQMSRDGRLIVFHDTTVERLTDGTGNILDLDFAYLRSLNAAAHFPGGWPEPQRIPTLAEALATLQSPLQVLIEVKASKRGEVYDRYPRIVEAVLNEVRAAHMLERALVISFDWSVLPEIRALEPALATGAIVSKEVWRVGGNEQATALFNGLVEQLAALGVSWISLDYRLFSPEMPAIVHAHGLQLNLWTVDDEEELRRLAAAGAASLTSNRPDLFAGL